MMSAPKSLFLWTILAFALGCRPSLHAQIADGQELVTLPSSDRVHELTLSTQVVTTITFPSEITMVSGYGMVLNATGAQEIVDSEKLAAQVSRDMATMPVTIVHYAQASPDTLAVRAVRRGTPCFVTVRCGHTFFLFKFTAGERANLAVVVQDPAASATNPVREVKKKEVVNSRIAFSSSELLGILSKARQREFLENVNPALYDGWQQRRDLALTSLNGDLVATIIEAQQWPKKDAIVLRAKVENKGAKTLRFKPVDVKVRVADRAYDVQLADSSGIVEPGQQTILDVVLQGNAVGGKEHLSIQNDFRLEVPIDRSSPPPNDVGPAPSPLLPSVESPRAVMVQPQPDQLPKTNFKPAPSDDPSEPRLPLPNLYGGK